MVRRVRGGILRGVGLSVAVCSREGVEDGNGHHLGFHNGNDRRRDFSLFGLCGSLGSRKDSSQTEHGTTQFYGLRLVLVQHGHFQRVVGLFCSDRLRVGMAHAAGGMIRPAPPNTAAPLRPASDTPRGCMCAKGCAPAG